MAVRITLAASGELLTEVAADSARTVSDLEAAVARSAQTCCRPRLFLEDRQLVSSETLIEAGIEHDVEVCAVLCLAPQALVATSSADGTAMTWSTDTGQRLQLFAPLSFPGVVWAACLDPDGRLLATGAADGFARLWKVDTGDCLLSLSCDSSGVSSVAFAPDGQQFSAGSKIGLIKLWNVTTGECVWVLEGHVDIVVSMVFAPFRWPVLQPPMLLTGADDQSARLWNLDAQTCEHTWTRDAGDVISVAFTHAGAQVVTYMEDHEEGHVALIYDVLVGKCTNTGIRHDARIWSAAFAPNGQEIATASADYNVKLWVIATGDCILHLEHPDQVNWVSFATDGSKLAAACDDGTAKIWDLKHGDGYGTCALTLEGHVGPVWMVSFVP